jgi:hypothetical protein
MGTPIEPLPSQAQASRPPLRRSSRLFKLQQVEQTPTEQEEAEDSEGDPVYQNPELPEDTFYDTFEQEVEDGGNGSSEEVMVVHHIHNLWIQVALNIYIGMGRGRKVVTHFCQSHCLIRGARPV